MALYVRDYNQHAGSCYASFKEGFRSVSEPLWYEKFRAELNVERRALPQQALVVRWCRVVEQTLVFLHLHNFHIESCSISVLAMKRFILLLPPLSQGVSHLEHCRE
jgi:hypothetical protein